MQRLIIAFFLVGSLVFGQAPRPPVTTLSGLSDVNITSPLNLQVLTYDTATSKWINSTGGGGGAPLTATYITQTPDGTLTNEQALSSLATGLLKNTTGTGVLTSVPDSSSNWDTGFSERRQWDGGSTNLVPATGRTSLGLVIGTNVQAWDADLDNLALITGNSKFAFRNSSGVWQARGLGTNLSDDGTNINATGGGGTPGGANTNIQYNDGGVFGGDANLTWNKTTFALTQTGNQNAATLWTVQNNNTGTGAFSGFSVKNATHQFAVDIFGTGFTPTGVLLTDSAWLYSDATGGMLIQSVGGPLKLATSSGAVQAAFSSSQYFALANNGEYVWSSTSDPLATSDTALARNATGIVEINNGTAGQYRDLKLRNLILSAPGAAGYEARSDGTNIVSYPDGLSASSTTTVSSAYASDTYLAGSTITVAAGDWKAQGQYRCEFDMSKTGGTGAFTVNVRMGTAGAIGDASVGSIAFGAGTNVADTGIFTVYVTFRTVGSGTSAVIQMTGKCEHHLAATGLTNTGAAGIGIITGTSAGFNSTTQTKIGISVNGGASFGGTNNFVQATLRQP